MSSKVCEFENNNNSNNNNGSFDSSNYNSAHNGNKNGENGLAHFNENSIHNNFTFNSNNEIEKKSKSKNRKRDRNREKEKKRGRDRAEKDLIKKSTTFKIEKENASIHLNNVILPSTTTTSASFSTSNAESIIEVKSQPCMIRKDSLLIEEKIIPPTTTATQLEGRERGVAKRTRSSHSNFEILLPTLITKPIIKKIEKVNENGIKRSHKKKKVEPKITKCSCPLPLSLPSSFSPHSSTISNSDSIEKCKYCSSKALVDLPTSTSTSIISTTTAIASNAAVTFPSSTFSISTSIPPSTNLLLPQSNGVSEKLPLSPVNVVVTDTVCVMSEDNNINENPIIPMKVEKEVETVRSSWFSLLS